MTGSETASTGHRTRWIILALILATQTAANVGPLGLPAIAALIRDELGLTLTQAGSFLSVYYIGPILISVPAGNLADRWGVGRMLVAGQVLVGLGLVAAAGTRSWPALAACIAVAGFGYGILNLTSTKAAMLWFPPRQRATVVGIKQVGLPFGGAIGAAALPGLALVFGWRPAVAASTALIGVTVAATLALYRDPPETEGRAGPARRARAVDVLRNRDLWLVALATLVFAGLQTVFIAYLVLYLQAVVRLPLVVAARYLALAQVAGMTGRVVFGLLSDRAFGGRRRGPLLLAGSGSALCAVAMAATGPGSSPLWLGPLALVFGFVGIGWNGVQHTLLAELAGPHAAATALGLGLALASIGVTVGPPLFGWWVEAAGGYAVPWIGLAAAMLLALSLLGLVHERPRPS